MRVLILGGTTEASALARLVAADPRVEATLSLAGRTASPAAQPIPCRIGGFGGARGLQAWLGQQEIAAVVDATHPFAVRIAANAAAACGALGVPLASIVRPPWQPQPGDRWISVTSAAAAAAALPGQARRVFLTVGRLELAAFARAAQHSYLARTIDPPRHVCLPPHIRFLFDRGPFDAAAETALLRRERIEIVVSKNSGGTATYGKIAAARRLGLSVVMVARPEKPAGHAVKDAAAAHNWLGDLHVAHVAPGAARGV